MSGYRFWKSERGVAAVEFALSAPFMILFFISIADFGFVFHKEIQLSAALSAGAEYAFTQGQTETGSTLTTDVTGFVNKISAVPLSSVSASYNNGLSATSCYCENGAGASFSFTGPYTCGSACTDGSGSTAGKYVSISAAFTYSPMFPSDQIFYNASLSQSVLVRLQ
jgi:Flp pilus assembly protein TadG